MKLKIPFLNSNNDAALSKIEAALAAVENMQRQRQQLQAEVETVSGSLIPLEQAAQRLRWRVEGLQERIKNETDHYGNQPMLVVKSLAVAENEYRQASQAHTQAKAQYERLNQTIRDRDAKSRSNPVTVSITDVVAIQEAVKETDKALAKIDAALATETARLSEFRVDDSAVVEARRALEDLLADAIDDTEQALDIGAAKKRLQEAEKRLAADVEKASGLRETTQQLIAGLTRKQELLRAEQHRRGQLLEHAQRLFFDAEIDRAKTGYCEAMSRAKTHYQSLDALCRLGQRALRADAVDPTRIDIDAGIRAERERFARLGLAI